MAGIKIDPFEKARKNAHIWRGEECLIWYNERIDDSFTVLVLYDFGDKKRRLFLDVDKAGQKIEFKNEEIYDELFRKLEIEINMVQKLLDNPAWRFCVIFAAYQNEDNIRFDEKQTRWL